MDIVDIHTHILPGIDDGPATMADTLGMLACAHRSGTRTIVATPHMFLDLFPYRSVADVQECFHQLLSTINRLAEAHPFLTEINILLGAENYMCIDLLEAAERRAVLGLNGSRYLLVESSSSLSFSHVTLAVRRLLSAGYKPVMVHPERNIAIQEKPSRVDDLLTMGCFLAVNGESLVNPKGKSGKAAQELLDRQSVHVIASDGHGVRNRSVELQEVLRWLRARYPEDQVRSWLSTNPRAILLDETLSHSC